MKPYHLKNFIFKICSIKINRSYFDRDWVRKLFQEYLFCVFIKQVFRIPLNIHYVHLYIYTLLKEFIKNMMF